jgi:hypothetical protein
MKLGTVVLVLMGVVGLASAQKESFKVVKLKAAPAASGDVTRAEAVQVMSKVRRACREVLGVSVDLKPTIATGKVVVSRREVLEEFATIHRAASASFKLSPQPVSFDPKRFTVQSPALTSLVKGGFVAKVGPLAAGKRAGVSPTELGDAIGFFVARLAEVTHLPSSRWTPYLADER